MEGLALIWDLFSGFCVDVVFWFYIEVWKLILFGGDGMNTPLMQAVRIVMGLVWAWGHFRFYCNFTHDGPRELTMGEQMFHDSRNIAHALDTIDASRNGTGKSSGLISRSHMDKY